MEYIIDETAASQCAWLVWALALNGASEAGCQNLG